MCQRALRILIALDIFVFALLTLGGAKRNETISAAAYSLWLDDKWQGRVFMPLIDWLFSPFEKEHCKIAWYTEVSKHG